jgi:hypothetical protein
LLGHYRVDLIVADAVLVEVKCVENIYSVPQGLSMTKRQEPSV